MILKVVIILILLFWPISLLLNTPSTDWLTYITPLMLLIISYVLKKNNNKYFLIPILGIPFISPKLSLFPILFTFAYIVTRNRNFTNFCVLVVSIIVLFFNWNLFKGQTIFTKDYEAQQKVIRETQLYDSVFLARVYHNKVRIYADKFSSNFFALIDVSNYFFGFHPRQIPGYLNIEKFPFLSIVFILYGLYYLKDNLNKVFIFLSFASLTISLSVLNIFDKNDLILWLPLSLLIIEGVKRFENKFKSAKIFFLIFIIFTLVEYLRLFSN